MRIHLWDILAVIVLLVTIMIGVVFTMIYSDPSISLNPFPPPTLPALLVLPSASYTPYHMPATWTPVSGSEVGMTGTLAPSSTPLPSSTSFLLPTATDTHTPTATFTLTSTVTRTPTITLSPSATRVPTKTFTFTPQPTATLTSSATQTEPATITASPPAP